MLRRFWNEQLGSLFMESSKKVIVVAGTTGVGKSQLSIQLAERFNGEVINSDSMQVYKGLPIITNKHPVEERNGVAHHVMDHVGWTEEYYLHRFEKECNEAIRDIHSRNKIAIVVGGTHYYLQCLFRKHLDAESKELTSEEDRILKSGDPQLVYDTLEKCDPAIAHKFHPNDTRRVQRMLEIFYRSGRKPSETYAEQQTTLLYDTLFFWLYSDPDPLNKRLDDRVDKMLETGGMEEINELYEFYKANDYNSHDCENGVWQVIGFKEFLPWLTNQSAVSLEDCVERMKIRTRQYAKKQVKWIKKMLIPDINGEIFLLDATDLSQWDQNVAARSRLITDQFVAGHSITEKNAPERLSSLIAMEAANKPKADDWRRYTCEFCRDQDGKQLIAIGERNWAIHMKSRRHRSNSTRGARKAAYEKWKSLERESSET